MTDQREIMRPVQVRDFTASLFKMARQMRLITPGGQVETVTPAGDKGLAVTFEYGTCAVLSVTVYRAQGSEEESDDGP